MTISARLSRTLHLAFGEDGAADMTNWMNTVDDHRSELRELHDLGMARIDARFGEFEARMDARFAQVDARFAQIDGRFDAVEARVDAKLDRLRAELIKWTFLFWCGTMAIVLLGQR